MTTPTNEDALFIDIFRVVARNSDKQPTKLAVLRTHDKLPLHGANGIFERAIITTGAKLVNIQTGGLNKDKSIFIHLSYGHVLHQNRLDPDPYMSHE